MKVNKIPEERIFERIYSDKNYRGIRVFFSFSGWWNSDYVSSRDTIVQNSNRSVPFVFAQLLVQKVGTTRSSAAHHYAFKTDRKLWEHLQKFIVPTLEEGVAQLR